MKKLGILVSRRGSNMCVLLDACATKKLQATVAVVISNNSDSVALMVARKRNIDALHLSSKTHPNANQLDISMAETLSKYQVDFVLLAGFMKKIGSKTLTTFKNRIFNIHPSLLPKFGGQGMYGLRAHEAVIAAGEKESGVTIQLVDDDYDNGMILAQRSIPVTNSDTAKSLAVKILKLEHVLYTETIQKVIDGSIILPNE